MICREFFDHLDRPIGAPIIDYQHLSIELLLIQIINNFLQSGDDAIFLVKGGNDYG